jgi:hypothetical protein
MHYSCNIVLLMKLQTRLAATMVRWGERGVNQGLLPMTISEEERNLFCTCHLLNCDEGQGQSITGIWYIVNGARKK